MMTVFKFCQACDRFVFGYSNMACPICDGPLIDREVESRTSAEVQHVVCKACAALFDRSAHADCPECGKTYIPDARELLAPQTPAQREAVVHAERIRAQFTAQERALAESQLSTTKTYRPLPPWKQRLYAVARGIRAWGSKIRTRKARTP